MIYALSTWKKLLIYAFIVAISLGLPIGTIQTMQKPGSAEVSLIVLAVILVAFLIYLVKTVIAINADPFKAVTVDFDSKQLIVQGKNNLMINLPFEQVQRIDIIKGEILRGITLGHLRILDKNGTVYPLTISKPDAFYVNMTSYLPMALDERMFFGTK